MINFIHRLSLSYLFQAQVINNTVLDRPSESSLGNISFRFLPVLLNIKQIVPEFLMLHRKFKLQINILRFFKLLCIVHLALIQID